MAQHSQRVRQHSRSFLAASLLLALVSALLLLLSVAPVAAAHQHHDTSSQQPAPEPTKPAPKPVPTARFLEYLRPSYKDFQAIHDTICLHDTLLPKPLDALLSCPAVRAHLDLIKRQRSGEIIDTDPAPSTNNGDSSNGMTNGYTSKCIFCRIQAGELESDKVYEDDQFVVFHDISPSAKIHLLVIPRDHIKSVKTLTPADIPMLKAMHEIGVKLISDMGISPAEQRYGFHVPPFNSIGHLHLHVMGKPFKNAIRAAKYPDSWEWAKWWIPFDKYLASLVKGGETHGMDKTWEWSWAKL
ncbi:HIT-like domain-containing protein [Entophlyctis helioformis]|nr:HIT-like domain-containing protein [Entophlyctis helioformis]